MWTDNATKTLNAAVRPLMTGVWQPAARVSPAEASNPRLAIDEAGNAVALWDMPAGTRVDVQTADLTGGWQPVLANTRRPVIRGTPRVGRTLTCDRGVWEGTAPIRYAYRWRRNGAPVRGAVRATFRVRRSDAGALVACRVAATNPAKTLEVASRPVRVSRAGRAG